MKHLFSDTIKQYNVKDNEFKKLCLLSKINEYPKLKDIVEECITEINLERNNKINKKVVFNGMSYNMVFEPKEKNIITSDPKNEFL